MLNYRPDIDGLRAIAVLSVLFYHLDESLLTGGFVGVDIFFVISGYLITKLIIQELRVGQGFSFKRFYIRRVRRLFPALFATLLASLIAAASLMSPAHLIEFGQSAVAAIVSVSNVFFWSSAGYFDSQSQLKPLLHTWSLSVEEQFYFIWPAVLVGLFALRNKGLIPAFIVFMGVASLVLNYAVFENQAEITAWFSSEDNQSTFSAQSTAFYWLPFRVYEFALGALLVFIPAVRARYLAELLFCIGLALIIYSISQLTSKMDFPSTVALLPCLGAAFMIQAGGQHRLTWLVSNRAAVGIGLISYSLYLVHWPIIVFYKYRDFEALGNSDYLVICALSLALAALFYKFVEQPFRKPNTDQASPHKKFLLGAACSALLLIAINAHAAWSGGWLQRYPADVVAQLSYKKGDYTEYFWSNLHRLERGFVGTEKPKVLVIGDSMAADFVNVLVEGGVAEQLDLATVVIGDNCKAVFPLNDKQYSALYGGAGELCRSRHQKVLDQQELLKEADTIILASYWLGAHWVRYVKSTVGYLNNVSSANVMVLGLKDQTSDGIWFLSKHAFSPKVHTLRTPLSPLAGTVNQKLRSNQQGYIYFDLLNRFCNGQGCQRVTEDGYVIIFDQAHLSAQGAKYLGQNIDSTSWFKLLLKTKDVTN